MLLRHGNETCWQYKSGGNEVQIEISSLLVLLCQWIAFSLQIPPISLHVLNHQILPCQLVVV